MKELPNYKKEIETELDNLNETATKCGDVQLPFIAKLCREIPKITTQALTMLKAGSPRIMLFGTYNAGKSTLLNALAGEEKAKVGDIPTTDSNDEFNWNGYELVDTPGINAPIEHERTSFESIKKCQVIIFVISSDGSFEDSKIYEAMKKVIEMDKRLFIVLNDKAGYGLKSADIANIKDAIQKNLIASGVDRQAAASFSFNVVNARDALEGKLEKDEELLEDSGILLLEQRIMDEIRRVNGFMLIADACKYVIDEIKPMCASSASSQNELLDEFLSMRVQYGEFLSSFENRVEDICGSMPGSLRQCFGSPDSGVEENQIKECMKNTYDRYGREIQDKFLSDCKLYLAHLSKIVGKLLNVDMQEADVIQTTVDSSRINEIQNIFREARNIKPDMPPSEEKSSGITFKDIVPLIPVKLPIPIPVPPIIIMQIARILFDALFGESDAEKRNRRIEAEARARRDAEERQAREVERYRQELKQYCEDISGEFRTQIRQILRKRAAQLFEPLFTDIEDEYKKQEHAQAAAVNCLNRIGDIISRIEIIRSELRIPSLSNAY